MKKYVSFFGCLFVFVTACYEFEDYSNQSISSSDQAMIDSLSNHSTSADFTMDIIQEGILKVKLRGKEAAHYTSRELNQTLIEGPVYFDVYDVSGDTSIVGFAQSAIYESDQAIFTMIGEVLLNSENKRRLYTPDTLIWNQQSDEISTNNFIVIVTPEDSISGYGLVGKSDLSQYTIRNISGKTAIDD